MIIFIFFINIILSEAIAIEPNEILKNKELEAQARAIGKELRCLVCQNEDIQNSNADIAKDLRKIVRIKLQKGESVDLKVIEFNKDSKRVVLSHTQTFKDIEEIKNGGL